MEIFKSALVYLFKKRELGQCVPFTDKRLVHFEG